MLSVYLTIVSLLPVDTGVTSVTWNAGAREAHQGCLIIDTYKLEYFIYLFVKEEEEEETFNQKMKQRIHTNRHIEKRDLLHLVVSAQCMRCVCDGLLANHLPPCNPPVIHILSTHTISLLVVFH